MALSVIVYPGDGVTTQFNIPFALGYIKESDITARVGDEQDGTGNPIYRTLTFLSPTSVVVSGTPAPLGTNIVFQRTVDREQLIVDYEDGDIINEENMNTAQRQAIMLVHEVLDGRFSQFQSSFDMGGFRITGAGDPVDPQDVSTKNYTDARISTGQASAAAAAASAAAAFASQNAAAGSASSASTSASTATTQAGIATTKATEANNSAVSAGASKDAAAISETNAATSQSAAAGSALSANTSAENAAVSETNAQKWAANPEDVVVSAGLYSAYHYSRKAATSAVAAANSASAALASQNAAAGSATSAGNSATAAATSAAAAATFDPVLYKRRSGALLTDEKTSGTNGGDLVAGWQNHVLTTERYDFDNLCVVAANSFTVAYDCIAHYETVVYHDTGANVKARLYSNTAGAAVGPASVVGYTKGTAVKLCGTAVLTAGHNYYLQVYSSAAQASNGLGPRTNDGGNECYAQIYLERI